jgi:oligopeptide transport system substrate-binding protein
MPTMRRLLAMIACLLFTGMVGSWLSWAAPRSLAPVIALSLPRSLDPCMATRLDEFRLITALFEPLVRLDAKTLQPQAALATHWETNADQSVWTFYLDPRARWSDGQAVTSMDMRRGLLRHLITQSPNAFYLEGLIAGAHIAATDLGERRTRLEKDCGLICPNALTLIVRLTHPAPYLTAILSLSAFVPLTEQHDRDDDIGRQQWTNPRTIVGNGPFRCTDYTPRHSYMFTPNPIYGGAHPARGAIQVAIIENPGTALRLYLSGEVDAILLLPADAVGDLRRAHIPGLVQSTSMSTAFWRVRIVPRPNDRPEVTAALQHPLLRRALATGFDRNMICQHLLQGNAVPATTFVPGAIGDYLPYHAPVALLQDNLEQARKDIAVVKSDLGALPVFELVAPSQPAERQSIAELIADQWQRNLGVRTRLTILPQTELRSREKNIDYDLTFAMWLGDFLDPTTFLDCFRIDGGANRTGFAEPRYDALLDQASASLGKARWNALESAEQRLVEAIPLIPILHNACSFLVRPTVGGITVNPLEIVHFDDIGWASSKDHAP